MNALALLQVQQGLYGKLSGDGVLMGMINALYDQVPERAQFPYAIIGDGAFAPLRTHVPLAGNCSMRIRVYSQKPGRKEVLRILDRIYGLLHLGTLTLVESITLSLHITQVKSQLLNDQRTIEGELTVNCLITEG
jgi:hypothetical protein